MAWRGLKCGRRHFGARVVGPGVRETKSSLRLACLDIGSHDLKTWEPRIIEKWGQGFYGMHREMFSRAGKNAQIDVKIDKFEPRLGTYPTVSEYDGVVITGCGKSANDGDAWLDELRGRIREWHPDVRLSGFSFGPQILAVALGGAVEKNPNGSELSVASVVLGDDFRRKFHHKRQNYLIHVHHNDHVLALPPEAVSIGSTLATKVAGFWIGDSVLCFMGHPEYSMDPWTLNALLEVEKRDHLVAAQHVHYAQSINYKRTDWLWQTELQLRWFAGEFDDPNE